MIGFEMTINDKIAVAIASKSVQLFLTTIDQENMYAICNGIDELGNGLKWPNQKLEEGDRIKITIKDLSQITPILVLKEEPIDQIIERYNKLKSELKNEGLL